MNSVSGKRRFIRQRKDLIEKYAEDTDLTDKKE
jgi:hypothetical protein